MQTSRRELITGGALALVGGGFLSRVDRVAAMQGGSSSSLTAGLKQRASGASEALLLSLFDPHSLGQIGRGFT